MFLLIVYVLIALGFSFLCSIAEAVLLSVNSAYIALMEKSNRPSGPLLRKLKDNVNEPLAAILTLNTVAHTVGAAGAGAQAAIVFGSGTVGIASAILTLLILIFSEIIPKTLGAQYWKQLAPMTAFTLKYLILILFPFVKLSQFITDRFKGEPHLTGFSREEFAAMAELGSEEGELANQESEIVKNLLALRETPVKEAMTPRTVLFSLPEELTVEEFFHKYDHETFSRIPVYRDDRDDVTGFVFRSDLLLGQARGNSERKLKEYRRELTSILGNTSLNRAFDDFLRTRVHMMLIVNEYGGVEGVITLEDIIETMLGMEIVDEKDKTVNMQVKARKLWQRRRKSTEPDT